ncbi:hypothetical protein NDU88_004258 [Pleurodeles waltl]|uniref:Secreted protein n=1 Tax=Pleurodeles waltl TaxID=8319 RepID=A0AAV7W982_PLEWA|nr:hypothetical protein NDU88_004258 [Pleurodeles waltl]
MIATVRSLLVTRSVAGAPSEDGDNGASAGLVACGLSQSGFYSYALETRTRVIVVRCLFLLLERRLNMLQPRSLGFNESGSILARCIWTRSVGGPEEIQGHSPDETCVDGRA